MIWDKMGWKSNQNEGQNDIYYLAINEWGWVGYEELSRSRRVLSTEAEGLGGEHLVPAVVLTLETSEMSAIFQVHNQNNSTSSPGLLG